MAYGDWIIQFKNSIFNERYNSFGKKEPIFIKINEDEKEGLRDGERVEIFEKGCAVWLVGEKYPIRGVTPGYKVTPVTQYKKLVPMWIKFLIGGEEGIVSFTKKSKFKQGLIVMGLLLYKEFFINWLWYALQEVYNEERFYGQPVRELYRLIKNEKVRDILCAVLEYDTAYRYRLQDIMVELDKVKFEKNPIKELDRLLKIMISRECKAEDDKKILGMRKIGKIIPLLNIYLFFNRKLLKELKRIVKEIKVEEVKLSVEDIYWTNKYRDYNFGGIEYSTRYKQYEISRATL